MNRIGVYFHPALPRAETLAEKLDGQLDSEGVSHWVCSAWDEAEVLRLLPGTDLVVVLGGDGTVLRAARVIQPEAVPILAARMGRVSFLAEVEAEDVLNKLRDYENGDGWIDERSMLSVTVGANGGMHHALNDVVVSRGVRPRVIHVRTSIDGEYFTTFSADGVVLATPTGSTGYAMAAGGPLLHPNVQAMVVTPIAPHLSMSHPVVVPASAKLELQVLTDHEASMTVDGQLDLPLEDGDKVHVRLSERVARFLRFGNRSKYYAVLSQRLACKERIGL